MKTVKLSALTPEAMKQIVTIYHNTVGGTLGKTYNGEHLLWKIKEDFRLSNSSDWRFGSRLSMHSKLQVREVYDSPFSKLENPVVKFIFYANMDHDPHFDKEAEKLEKAFETAVDKYLVSVGLAL